MFQSNNSESGLEPVVHAQDMPMFNSLALVGPHEHRGPTKDINNCIKICWMSCFVHNFAVTTIHILVIGLDNKNKCLIYSGLDIGVEPDVPPSRDPETEACLVS